jgi:hypothetical protein
LRRAHTRSVSYGCSLRLSSARLLRAAAAHVRFDRAQRRSVQERPSTKRMQPCASITDQAQLAQLGVGCRHGAQRGMQWRAVVALADMAAASGALMTC